MWRLSVNAGDFDRLLEAHQLRRLVGHFDADRRFAWDERLDPDRRGQRKREVGLIPEDAAHRHADRRLQLVLRDRRPAVGPDDAGFDSERLQSAHDLVTCGTNLSGQAFTLAGDGVEQLGGRQHPDLLRLVADHHGVTEADLRNRPDQRHLRVARGGAHALELAGEAVFAEVLAGGLRLLGVEEGGQRRRGHLGRVERQQHRHPGQLGGRLGRLRREPAGACRGRPRRSIAAQPLAFGGEPPAECTDHRAGAEVGGQDDSQDSDDHERGARPGATEHALDARADPATQRTRVGRPDHPDQSEERDHGDGAAERRKRARSPLGCHAQTCAGEHEPGNADPGADPEGAEEPVVYRPGDRPTAGKDQHRGEDHARADRPDAGQLTAQVAVEQGRPRPGRGARACARRWTP